MEGRAVAAGCSDDLQLRENTGGEKGESVASGRLRV